MEGIAISVILLAPILSKLGVSFVFAEDIVFRLALVLLVIYAVRQNSFSGILTMLAAFSLLTERNHELLTGLPFQKPIWPASPNSSPFTPPFLTPETETVHYDVPHTETEGVTVSEVHGEHTTEKEYEDSSDLSDNIPRLSEAPSSEDAPLFYQSKGLA
jgi:hypothetical protein